MIPLDRISTSGKPICVRTHDAYVIVGNSHTHSYANFSSAMNALDEAHRIYRAEQASDENAIDIYDSLMVPGTNGAGHSHWLRSLKSILLMGGL